MTGAEKAGEVGLQQKREDLAELHVSETKGTGKTSRFLYSNMSRKENPRQCEKSW